MNFFEPSLASRRSLSRQMFLADVSSWNLRDSHMVDALFSLQSHLTSSLNQPSPAKIVVWAHNSHLGDARATSMGGARGEWNVGQLVRERVGDKCVNVGFTTHEGSVTAGEFSSEATRAGR